MLEVIEEPIKVGALFTEEGLILPKWFLWKGKKYSIQEITCRWKERKGRAQIHYFSAFDGVNLYELALDSEEMQWQLMKVYFEG